MILVFGQFLAQIIDCIRFRLIQASKLMKEFGKTCSKLARMSTRSKNKKIGEEDGVDWIA